MASELIQSVKNNLLNNIGLQPEKLDDFVKESAAHLRKVVAELDDAIENGDFELIIYNAHKLKGCLCNLGLEELSMVAKNIEITAAGNAPAYLGCYLMRLQRELKDFLEL